MNLYSAKQMLVRDQLDWNKPHLNWLPEWAYRLFRETKH